jgi:hypothetical protein
MNTRVVGDRAPCEQPFPAETLRAHFPALRRAKPFIFFDNAAGAQIPQTVLDAVNLHLLITMCSAAGAIRGASRSMPPSQALVRVSGMS